MLLLYSQLYFLKLIIMLITQIDNTTNSKCQPMLIPTRRDRLTVRKSNLIFTTLSNNSMANTPTIADKKKIAGWCIDIFLVTIGCSALLNRFGRIKIFHFYYPAVIKCKYRWVAVCHLINLYKFPAS